MNRTLETLDLLKAVIYALERECEGYDTRSEVVEGLVKVAGELIDRALEIEQNSPDWADRQ